MSMAKPIEDDILEEAKKSEDEAMKKEDAAHISNEGRKRALKDRSMTEPQLTEVKNETTKYLIGAKELLTSAIRSYAGCLRVKVKIFNAIKTDKERANYIENNLEWAITIYDHIRESMNRRKSLSEKIMSYG